MRVVTGHGSLPNGLLRPYCTRLYSVTFDLAAPTLGGPLKDAGWYLVAGWDARSLAVRLLGLTRVRERALRRRVHARLGVGVREGCVGAGGGGGARDLRCDLGGQHAARLGAWWVCMRLEAAAQRRAPPALLHPARGLAAAAERRERVRLRRRRPLEAAPAVRYLLGAPPAAARPHRGRAAACAIRVRCA